MRGSDGTWLAAPPAPPPITTAVAQMNLFSFVDVVRPFLGTVLSLAQLRHGLVEGGVRALSQKGSDPGLGAPPAG